MNLILAKNLIWISFTRFHEDGRENWVSKLQLYGTEQNQRTWFNRHSSIKYIGTYTMSVVYSVYLYQLGEKKNYFALYLLF